MTDAFRSRRSQLSGAAIEAGLVGAAGVIDQAARFVIGVVAAGVLGPVVFGSWSLIAVVIQYANVLSLGVSTGAARAIPIARGAADEPGVMRIEASARFSATASSLLAGLAAALVVWLLVAGAIDWWLCGLVGLAVVAQQQVVLDQSLFRSRFQFQRAGVEGLAQGITGLVAGLVLLPLGIVGLIASRIAAGLAALAVGAPGRRGRPEPAWDAEITRSLIRQGFPIVFAASMFGLLITIDRWVVLGLYGDVALGQFSLASIVLSGLLMISVLVSQQHLARTAFRFGADGDPSALLRRAWVQGGMAVGVALPAAIVADVAAILAIPRWLPEYEPAIAPIVIASVGAVGYSCLSGFPNALGILHRGRALVLIQALALAGLLVLCQASAAAGLGLPGISLATAVSLVALGLASALASTLVVRRGGLPKT
jgi:O-antigen/teichoic acid export membrane protein